MPAISSDYIFKPKYLIYYEKKKKKKSPKGLLSAEFKVMAVVRKVRELQQFVLSLSFLGLDSDVRKRLKVMLHLGLHMPPKKC